ncbi:MAG: isopentenyl phosphate kinase [Methanomassiliicoccales archaeon]
MVLSLVKLGGSVITEKNRPLTMAVSNCKRLARELSSYLNGGENNLILVHGGGSFGHMKAKKYDLSPGRGRIIDYLEVRNDMRALNHRLISLFLDNGIRCLSTPADSLWHFRDATAVSGDLTVLSTLLNLKVVPITFGDVVCDDLHGFSIVSGDSLMLYLSKHFRPDITIFCTDVDGVYDKNPKTSADARMLQYVDTSTLVSADSNRNDVTGGMSFKLRSMLSIAEHSGKTVVLNGRKEGRLASALAGAATTCTIVRP